MEYKAIEKYKSMLRAFEKLEIVATNNGNTISNADARDTAETFFNHCYHLKDWLKNDSTLTLTTDIEKFITNDEYLSVAADYCNTHKHAVLDRLPRTGEQINKLNTHVNIDFTPFGVVTSSTQVITVGSKEYSSYELAKNCIMSWQRFLSDNNLNFAD